MRDTAINWCQCRTWIFVERFVFIATSFCHIFIHVRYIYNASGELIVVFSVNWSFGKFKEPIKNQVSDRDACDTNYRSFWNSSFDSVVLINKKDLTLTLQIPTTAPCPYCSCYLGGSPTNLTRWEGGERWGLVPWKPDLERGKGGAGPLLTWPGMGGQNESPTNLIRAGEVGRRGAGGGMASLYQPDLERGADTKTLPSLVLRTWSVN